MPFLRVVAQGQGVEAAVVFIKEPAGPFGVAKVVCSVASVAFLFHEMPEVSAPAEESVSNMPSYQSMHRPLNFGKVVYFNPLLSTLRLERAALASHSKWRPGKAFDGYRATAAPWLSFGARLPDWFCCRSAGSAGLSAGMSWPR